jgi:Uma2 family endonuclease
MAETDHHRNLMIEVIQTLKHFFRERPNTYVSGNLLAFYERGNPRRHVSPDAFVVHGVAHRERLNYRIWEESAAPNVVIEITSSSTRKVDQGKKKLLYQDTLQVPEYFLFDPYGEYLRPQLQGYRLVSGEYMPIEAVAERLPSVELGVHLEQVGNRLRRFDPATAAWVPTTKELWRGAEERGVCVTEEFRYNNAQMTVPTSISSAIWP